MKGIVKELIRAFGKALGNRYLILAIAIISVLTMGGLQFRSCQTNDDLNTYNRQLQGQLSDKEKELQSLNKNLGLARSELMTQKELAQKLAKDKEEVDANFNVFKKKHKLEIESRDRTIAELKQKIQGGNSTATVIECKSLDDKGHCVIAYTWEDLLKRFKLSDPNIFNSGDESFESNQIFKVYGEIWKQKDGSLKTRRLVLREVYKDKDGKFKPISNGKADIIDFEFQYENTPDSMVSGWKDIFNLRAMALESASFYDGSQKFGLGVQFLQYKNFGLNTHTAINFKHILDTEQRLGLVYSPKLFGLDLNVGIGLSVGTPFKHMFGDYSINGDLIFYLNN